MTRFRCARCDWRRVVRKRIHAVLDVVADGMAGEWDHGWRLAIAWSATWVAVIGAVVVVLLLPGLIFDAVVWVWP